MVWSAFVNCSHSSLDPLQERGRVFAQFPQCHGGLRRLWATYLKLRTERVGSVPALRRFPKLRGIVTTCPTVDLPDEDLAAIVTALRQAIDRERYPPSLRLNPLKSALTNLDPRLAPKAALEPLPEAPACSRGPRRTRQ